MLYDGVFFHFQQLTSHILLVVEKMMVGDLRVWGESAGVFVDGKWEVVGVYEAIEGEMVLSIVGWVSTTMGIGGGRGNKI